MRKRNILVLSGGGKEINNMGQIQDFVDMLTAYGNARGKPKEASLILHRAQMRDRVALGAIARNETEPSDNKYEGLNPDDDVFERSQAEE